MSDKNGNPIAVDQIKVGDLMSITYFVKVNAISQNGEKIVCDEIVHDIKDFEIEGKPLIASCQSADYYAEERKASRTTMAELLTSRLDRPFTVFFKKQDGSLRKLRGIYTGYTDMMGFSEVKDLDIAKDNTRKVDHRNLIWLIIDGVKYTRSDIKKAS